MQKRYRKVLCRAKASTTDNADLSNLPPLVRDRLAQKEVQPIITGQEEVIPESVFRNMLARRFGVEPKKLTADHYRRGGAELLATYPRLRIVPDGPMISALAPTEHTRLRLIPGAVLPEEAAMPTAITGEDAMAPAMSETEATDANSGVVPDQTSRKGDASLIDDKESVNFQIAELYLGIKGRQRQYLISSGVLKVINRGQDRRITTDSLRAKLQPKK